MTFRRAFDGPPELWPEYTEDSFKSAARLREEMTMSQDQMESMSRKQISIPVERTLVIDVLENQMVVCDGVFCPSAEQFHDVLIKRMQHPFATAPKPKRTRGPNKPRTDAEPRVTVPRKGSGK